MREVDVLPYGRQTIEQDDIDAVVRALRSDYLTAGPEVGEFEKELAQYCGSKYAVVCANGTAALHLASLALGLGPNTEVITSPITFMATSNSALYCGASVAFLDIDPHTGCLDPKEVRKYLEMKKQSGSEIRPAALYPIHFAGHPAAMQELHQIAREYDLKIVEDACHAIGSTYTGDDGRPAKVGSCQHSDMTVFSFHPVKHMTTAEGGAITTNDPALYQKLITLRSHGIVRASQEWKNRDMGFTAAGAPNPWYHEMQALGFNYRLTDVQCALGRTQLKKLDRFITTRRELADSYRTCLKEMQDLVRPLYASAHPGHSYHLFPVLIPFAKLGMERAELMQELQKRGIYTQVHYIPVHKQPYYKSIQHQVTVGDCTNSEKYYAECLTLPLFPQMNSGHVKRVVSALKEILEPRLS